MRIFFIPGLGEDVSIFDKIQPPVPGKKVFIDNWTLLAEVPEKGLIVLVYAQYLTDRFRIKKEDVVIGHSMGGWTALYIKHLTGCRIVQIASWTDSCKIIKVPIKRQVLVSQKRIWFLSLGASLSCLAAYGNKPSREIFITIFKRLRRGDKKIVAKQLMVIFNPVKECLRVIPDLRIHAKADHIVKYSDQNFHAVPGDHFTLYTHPQKVYEPIIKFLKQQK